MKKGINLIRFDMIMFQVLIMVYLLKFGSILPQVIIIIAFIITAFNLIYILYELEKIHTMIFKSKDDYESIALLDEEKRKSMAHIKRIKEIYKTETRESLIAYIERSQKEYYDEEVLTYDLEILNIILQRYIYICKNNDIEFEYDIQSNVKALLAAAEFTGEQLCTVLGNLLDNAIDVLKGLENNRHLDISILGNGYQVIILVNNSGPKIPTKVMEKLFNYGFSTKEDGRGTGLFIVYKLIEKLGATMSVDSNDEKTSFKIVFDLD